MKPQRICIGCQKPFSTKPKNKVYCTKNCRTRSYCKRMGISGSGLPTATTGTISELRVACDLLSRGYEVFRAVSGACSCDLAVLKAGKLLRIEVRTAYVNSATNKLLYPISKKDEGRFDVFAAVTKDKIFYLPEL